MKFTHTQIFKGTVFLVASLLAACSGGGGGGAAPASVTASYTVGGTTTGLAGTVVLQDNGGDNLSVSVNGAFTFATKVAKGSPYSVTVLTQPAKQACTVSTGTGTISASNVTNVAVSCVNLMGGAVQGTPLNLTTAVSSLAGAVFLDGTGTAAKFNNPASVASDGTNLYVADQSNNRIRKIVIATGVVTTLAGSGVPSALDGTGTAATFNQPVGITTDNTNLYVTDRNNNKIRKIVIATGVVSSLTGLVNTAVVAGAADGAGTTATFNSPQGITTDGTNLYVADQSNNKIRQIVIATGVVSSLTGVANTAGAPGAVDGTGTAATFFVPSGITTDGANLYVTDAGNRKIRKIVIATGVVSSLTGVTNSASVAGAVDGAGVAATFSSPVGITSDGTSLYVADAGRNNKIRQIVISTGAVTTLAGALPWADGTGAAASFNLPSGITTDGSNLYVADQSNNRIRKIVIASGVVTTLAGSGVPSALDGTGTAATFNGPSGITTDGTNLYVADKNNNKIRQIVIATGAVSSLTGVANTAGVIGAADGAATTATFNLPNGITTDGTNLYVADMGNNNIRKIVIASGVVSTLAGSGMAGAVDATGTVATFSMPAGITTDGANLYVADYLNNKIRQIVIATGAVSSLTGVANTAGVRGAADGAGTAATFNWPTGITSDGTNLYVADAANCKIRKIVIASGVVSTLAGSGMAGAVDATGVAATFKVPSDITSDGTNLYVADSNNNTIRKIQ